MNIKRKAQKDRHNVISRYGCSTPSGEDISVNQNHSNYSQRKVINQLIQGRKMIQMNIKIKNRKDTDTKSFPDTDVRHQVVRTFLSTKTILTTLRGK